MTPILSSRIRRSVLCATTSCRIAPFVAVSLGTFRFLLLRIVLRGFSCKYTLSYGAISRYSLGMMAKQLKYMPYALIFILFVWFTRGYKQNCSIRSWRKCGRKLSGS